jgi:hypothetical protein
VSPGADRVYEEVNVKRLVAGLAFLSSVAAFLVVVGGGLALLIIESSGERGAGAALALSGAIAFAAAMLLIFAGEGLFSGRGSVWAIIAALLGMLPVAALSVGALRFSGFPISSAVPAVDWPVFALGVVLALGAVSVLTVGYWRWKGPSPVRSARHAFRMEEHPPVVLRPPDQPGRAAAREPGPLPARGMQRPAPRPTPPAYDDEEDIRVTPVDLPSLGRFRPR